MNIYDINGAWQLESRLEALNSLKIDVLALNNQKETPLFHCVKNGLSEFIQPLLDQGSDINHVAGYGWTPLMSSLENNAFDISDILIKNKANIHQIIKSNFNAFSFAVMKMEIDNFDIAKQLLNLDIDTHLVSTYGKTALMTLIEEHNISSTTIEFICNSSKNTQEINEFINEIKNMKSTVNHQVAMNALTSLLLFHRLDQNFESKTISKVGLKI